VIPVLTGLKKSKSKIFASILLGICDPEWESLPYINYDSTWYCHSSWRLHFWSFVWKTVAW